LVCEESPYDNKKKKECTGQNEGSVANGTGSQEFRDPLSFDVKKINANERDQEDVRRGFFVQRKKNQSSERFPGNKDGSRYESGKVPMSANSGT
jgi:hypothetical protein